MSHECYILRNKKSEMFGDFFAFLLSSAQSGGAGLASMSQAQIKTAMPVLAITHTQKNVSLLDNSVCQNR